MNTVHMPLVPANANLQKINGFKHKIVEPMYAPVLDNLSVNGQTLSVNGQTEVKMMTNNVPLNDGLNGITYNSEFVCNFPDDMNYDGNINLNTTYHVVPNIPLNMMPPPPHNIVNNNNVMMQNFNRRESWKSRGEVRSNSPHGSESDESCRSFTSRDSPPDDKNKKNARNTCAIYHSQSLLYNKFSNSSPSVFYGSGINQNGNNIGANKPRYYNHSNNGRQRRDNKRHQPMDINRRVFGLMERFTSRAKMLHLIQSPPKLMTGTMWDPLNEAIWEVYTAKAQKEQTYIHKLELWRMVYIHIQKILVRYGLFMVGSTMSGLGTDKSDIDMCLLVKPCLNDPRSDALGNLQNIYNILMNCDFVKSPEVILAKVPILKFRDSQYGFEVDLNCNNAVGIRNTHLLHCYAHLDWRVRPLVVIVKLWAQANNINDAKNMTISSYSLALMVIHFLQCGVTPPAIPCLHGLYPEKFNPNVEIHSIDIQEELPKFNSDNMQSLGELLLGFLHYYTVFNYDRYAISVREGTVLLKEECRLAKSAKNDATQWKLLCIEEPFDLTNTARSVYDIDTFEHIKNVFHYSYNVLRETKTLSSILPMVENNQR